MSKNNFIIVIPARYNSSRLPGKPLKKINGVPMIIRTCNQCLKAVARDKIYVATDDKRISSVVDKYGFKYLFTNKKCLTGSDRVAEIAKKTNFDHYINVQGDEPIFNPQDIKKLLISKNSYKTDVLLGYTSIKEKEFIQSKNTPKITFDKKKNLIFASRHPISNKIYKKETRFYRQVLAYCFPRDKIIQFSKMDKKTNLERKEDIEILRFLEMGINVKLVKMSNKSVPVDTLLDLKRVEKILLNSSK